MDDEIRQKIKEVVDEAINMRYTMCSECINTLEEIFPVDDTLKDVKRRLDDHLYDKDDAKSYAWEQVNDKLKDIIEEIEDTARLSYEFEVIFAQQNLKYHT